MKSIARNIRISPKKLAVIATIVRGMDAQKALDTLKYMPTKGSALLYKVVATAIANATHNDQQEVENLKISTVVIGKGITYRR
jgi:large subunit ribosomal protein L22